MTESTEYTDNPRKSAETTAVTHAGVLPRRLGLLSLTFLIVAWNAPIAAMAGFQQLSVAFGNGIGAPVSFFVAGAILLLFAVGFVGMSRHVKNPGAFYCYIVGGLGRAPGLAGAFVATGAYILFAAGSYIYLGLIVVNMTNQLFGAPVLTWQVWAFVSFVVITILGLLRIDTSMRVIGTLVVLECAGVAIWQLAVFVQGGPEGYSGSTFTPHSFFSGSVGLGVLFAMLCMIGFEGGACFRDETRNPEKTVRRATFSAIGFMTVFYGLGCWVYIITQGPSHVVSRALNDPVGSFFTSIDTYLGGFFPHLFAVLLVTSQSAAIIAIQGNGSRYLYALGRDRVLSPRLARVHKRLNSPHVAVLALATVPFLSLVIVTATGVKPVPAYAALTGAGIYFLLPLLIATSVAVIIYFRKHRELHPGPWVGVIAPVLAAVSLTVLFVLTTDNLKILASTSAGAVGAEVALVVVALSGFLLALRYKSTRPDVYQKIGNQ
jgi:amino acid transporter